MTLRELLNRVLDAGQLSRVFKVLYEEYYSEQPIDEIDRISCTYALVCRKLLELDTSLDGSKYHILVRECEDDLSDEDETYIDTCLFETQEEAVYAIDMTVWGELINMEVNTSVKLDDAATLAHILWEITFYGFSEDKIQLAKEELEVLIERIDSGEEELHEWKDMEKEFNRLKKGDDLEDDS